MSVRVVFANRSGFDAGIGVVRAWEERGSCLNIFRTKNRDRILETFTNYEAKDMLRKSGFDAPIGVVKAWEERGSCLDIFWMINRGQISETLTNYEAKDLLRKWAWEERGSCLNIFEMKNYGRISETFTNYESKDLLRKGVKHTDLKNLQELRGKRLVAQVSETRRFALYLRTGEDLMRQLDSSCHGRSVDHVLTYSRQQIVVGSQKPSRIMKQKTCCAIGVVKAWEERGSCLNIFRTTNRGRITEIFTNYEEKDLLRIVDLMLELESSRHRRSVDHVLQYSGPQIMIASQKASRITRQKTCCAIVKAWEERGSCLDLLRMTNLSRISETFTNYEAKDLLRKHGWSVDHVLTYSDRQIMVGSEKTS
ncbi:uncharacterized protein G2W53_021974 [Senna tora]|uniref:Uncharacterized protein n=1 Tax=Senna tora TaxID=362788 RepID=A0A834TL60_9FABA|nr:uncharacterized protein G2W53_021974 [Senna tora]